MLLPTSHQMRYLDQTAIERLGIPGAILMENAGRGTVEYMVEKYGPVEGKDILIFIGPGNNGGDGLVIARTVLNQQARPHIFFLSDPATLKGDAALNYEIIERLGLHYHVLNSENEISQAEEWILNSFDEHSLHSIVDALFGIGLDREITGRFRMVIQLINVLGNTFNRPVVAADIPSGMNSDTGKIMGISVHADLTVTYGFPKPGHFHHGGPGVGELKIVDIGLPPQVHDCIQPEGYVLNKESIPVITGKHPASHKGTNGHLLILSGSTGKTGAAILCAQGALYSGIGLVTLTVPENLNHIFETTLPEAMTVPLHHSHGSISIKDEQQILSHVTGKSCLVVGPGIGTDGDTAPLVLKLYQETETPMVLDADALNILASHPEVISKPGGPRILTPHPGEMARLLDTTVTAVQSDRLAAACRLSKLQYHSPHPIITVLKGAGTVICLSEEQWCINSSGNPGMGTGGMGDVLAGIIGSLVSQGYSPWDGACLGVFLHGYSADKLSSTRPFGYTASEVARDIPEAIGSLSCTT